MPRGFLSHRASYSWDRRGTNQLDIVTSCHNPHLSRVSMRRLALRFLIIAFMLDAGFSRPVFGQVTDVLRGRVTGPDTIPLSGVTVRATSYMGSVTKTATTDKSGRFTIVFLNGEGDYWLDF